MNVWWKWLLLITVVSAFGIGLYFYLAAPENKGDNSVINIYRTPQSGNVDENSNQTIDKALSDLNIDFDFAQSDFTNSALDDILPTLSTFKE